MSISFTDDQLAALSAEVDAQLADLRRSVRGNPTTMRTTGTGKGPADLPPRQREAIERATGESAADFLARFKAAARNDICRSGGIIHTQWQKYREVTNKEVLKQFGAVLIGMGLAAGPVQVAVVALAVWFLHIGFTAFCADE